MRLDRPIGTWLLYWPCAWSVALAGVGGRWGLFLWFALGAFAMRSAGCVYNDVVDRDLDRRVERTRLRPLASGRVSVGGAMVLIALLLGNLAKIQRSVDGLLAIAGKVGANTANIPQLEATAPVLALIVDEAIVQDGYMNALTDGFDGK